MLHSFASTIKLFNVIPIHILFFFFYYYEYTMNYKNKRSQ